MFNKLLWPLLGTLFFLSTVLGVVLFLLLIFKPPFWINHKSRIIRFYLIWFLPYVTFILFFTGPEDPSVYPPAVSSPYKLPWASGVSRFVMQGNRSFTSHRGSHAHAWDFIMANGTEILAARAGKVVAADDEFSGIGLHSNGVVIEHEDGNRSGYFHIEQKSALVKVGDLVRQGQPVARSGMVGQTIYPHVHFLVLNKDESGSVPITFSDVPEGLPLAGHFYVSGNEREVK